MSRHLWLPLVFLYRQITLDYAGTQKWSLVSRELDSETMELGIKVPRTLNPEPSGSVSHGSLFPCAIQSPNICKLGQTDMVCTLTRTLAIPTCFRCPQLDAMLLASNSLWSGTPHAGYMPPLGYSALSYLNIPLPVEQLFLESKLGVPSDQQNFAAAKPKPRKPRQTKKWYEILVELERDPKQLSTQQSPASSSAFQQFVKTSIAAATKAAEKDKQWADSGVVQFLQQAARSFAEGDTVGARQQAVSLVDFHRIAASLRKTSNGALRSGGLVLHNYAVLHTS
jgi:hypothetical protein